MQLIKIKEKELREMIKETIEKALNFDGPLIVNDYFDLSKISKKNIESINYDLRMFLNGRGFGDEFFFDGDRIIAESANYTYRIGELRNKLKEIGFKKWQIASKVYANKVRVAILYVDIAKNTEIVIEEMKQLGWDKCRVSDVINIHGIDCRIIDFDPSIQKTLTKEAKNFNFFTI